MSDRSNLGAPGIGAMPPHYRRNATMFVLDMFCFRVASSFVNGSTVLPVLVATLSRSELVVGIAQGLIDGAWFLPQLLTASWMAGVTRKKRFCVRAVVVGRSLLFPLAVMVGFWGAERPRLVLFATILTFFVFYVADGIASVPWFEILAKALPDRRRGRVLGLGQVIGGMAGIGVGMAVRWILSDASPWTFPANYGVLLGLAACVFWLGMGPLLGLKEPEWEERSERPPTIRETLRSLPDILRRDPAFARLIVVRFLNSFAGVAMAFYVLHGRENLGFDAADIGLFVSAQVFGSLLAGFVTGLVQDRYGPLVHMRCLLLLGAAPPILALLALPLQSVMGDALVYYYVLLYGVIGVYIGSFGWPYINWVFEHTQEAERPLYVGLMNTFAAMAMLAPPLGGLLVSQFSYQVAFVTALVFALAALAASVGLADTRRGRDGATAAESTG